MKILILCPGAIPKHPKEIKCFSDMWAHYLVKELHRHVDVKTRQIPKLDDHALLSWFNDLSFVGYDAVIALGLRYFSTVPRAIGDSIRQRIYPGFLCQVHDGSRLDNDPVDITFTLKNEDEKYPFNSEANRYVRHNSFNEYVGWAADPNLHCPAQDPVVLRILVDHTNYGPNPVDLTTDVLASIKEFVDSELWKPRFTAVSVRRFDSGGTVDVDFDNITDIARYDRTTGIPLTDICKEHSAAHVFCVTHPESVGQVVLETAMAGALTLTPRGFIPQDRLSTVNAIEYTDSINWQAVLNQINPDKNRAIALTNTWDIIAKRIISAITIRSNIRKING